MAKQKLTVTSDLGTFTRTTARTYTHVVVVKGYKAERLEANRLAEIAQQRKEAAKYQRTIETGLCQDARPGTAGDFDRRMTATFLAEGRFQRWLAEAQAVIAALVARGPITEDGPSWSLDDDSTPVWSLAGWCGRLDLAQKLAAQQDRYRHVALIALDGTVITIR